MVIDNAPYFLDRAVEIFQDDYKVTEDDIFRTRVMTTGMTQKVFDAGGVMKLLLVDVGGQRSERRKWIRWFDGIDCVLFVVGISEFDQRLFEDLGVNRYIESMDVWKDIVNLPQFERTEFILFLNKVDIFQEKIKRRNVKDYIPEFDGEEHNFESCIGFFERQFLKVVDDRDVTVHYTTATDTDLMANLLDGVKSTILRRALDSTGFA